MPVTRLKSASPDGAAFTVQAGFHMVSYSQVVAGSGSPVARLQISLPSAAAEADGAPAERWDDFDTTNASFAGVNGAKAQWLPTGKFRWKLVTPGTAHEGVGYVSDL